MSGFGKSVEAPRIKHFGAFAFIVNRVVFGEQGDGTSYSIPGIPTRDGSPKTFPGKRLATSQDELRTEKKPVDHVVLLMKARNRDGEEYLKSFDCVAVNKERKWQILSKSLEVTFGKDTYPSTLKPGKSMKDATWIWGAIEEVPTGNRWTSQQDGSERDERAVKFTDWYDDEKKTRAAEAEYFGRSNGNSAPTITEEMIESVRRLQKAAKGDRMKLLEQFSKDDVLSLYDADELIKAAA